MAENKTTEEAADVEIDLDAQTFDLGAWIAGNHTYPSYKATIHMDKEAVARSNEALSEIKQLDKKLPDLRKAAENAGGSDSLAETSGPRAAYNKAVADRRKHIKAYNAFRGKAKRSELTFTFRSKGEDARKRVREEMEELIPELSSMSQNEIQEKLSTDEDLATKQQAMLVIELAEDIVTADGKHVDPASMTAEKVAMIFHRAASRDVVRISTNMNLAMLAADLTEEEVDAGFLG